jgi:hypothetical protein
MAQINVGLHGTPEIANRVGLYNVGFPRHPPNNPKGSFPMRQM